MKWPVKTLIACVVLAAFWIGFSLDGLMSGKAPPVAAISNWKVDEGAFFQNSKNIRWIRNDDGTYSVFKLISASQITKRVIKDDGSTAFVAVYRLDAGGHALGCKISDADGQPLYKVSFGYRKSDGKLVEERVFRDGATAASDVLCRVVYSENEQGSPAAPKFITPGDGRAEESIPGVPSALFINPFPGSIGKSRSE